MLKRIDNKYSTDGNIYRNGTGEILPDHEPKILFRAKDKLTIRMLNFYLAECISAGCTPQQEESMRALIDDFKAYQNKFPSSVKLPD